MWDMPFSYNSRENIGERERHLKTALKKLVFFASMWRDVLNWWLSFHPPVGLNTASSYNMNIIIIGPTEWLIIYVLLYQIMSPLVINIFSDFPATNTLLSLLSLFKTGINEK